MTGQDSGHIGSRIQRARLSAGLTQTQLAAALGVRERTISRWESAQSDDPEPSTRYLLKLCEVLDCSLMWLMTGEPNGEGVAA